MAHYALLDENNVVVKVITGVDEDVTQTDENGLQVGGTTEAWETFYASLPWFAGLTCKRTSYHGNIRANHAGVGFKYDRVFDVFIPPQPYPSWILNYETYQWKAPTPMPGFVEGFIWCWSEYNKEWVKKAL